MTDLTQITTPFGLLDESTREQLESHSGNGGEIELFMHDGWMDINPSWTGELTYRAKPVPVKDTQTHAMQMVTYGHDMEPSVSTCGQTGAGWINGKLTIETVDGKPVSATWKAYQ